MISQNIPIPDAVRLRELDASVERSLADLRAGRLTEADAAFGQLEAKYRRMAVEQSGRGRITTAF